MAARRLGSRVPVTDQDRPRVVEVERRGPGGDLVQHAAEGVEVAAVVDVVAADLLRRHVVRGAHGDAGTGESGGEADVVPESGYAEVADLHRAVAEPHDVRGLQIPVHDALLVGVRQSGGRLLADLHDVGDGQRMLFVVLQELTEVAPVQQLHHQIEHTVRLTEVVDDGHPAVLEGRRHPCLAAKPLPQDAGERVVVVLSQRFEALHGDLSAQRLVPGTPHLTHPPRPIRSSNRYRPWISLVSPICCDRPRRSAPPSPGPFSMASYRPTLYGATREPGPSRDIARIMCLGGSCRRRRAGTKCNTVPVSRGCRVTVPGDRTDLPYNSWAYSGSEAYATCATRRRR